VRHQEQYQNKMILDIVRLMKIMKINSNIECSVYFKTGDSGSEDKTLKGIGEGKEGYKGANL